MGELLQDCDAGADDFGADAIAGNGGDMISWLDGRRRHREET